MAGLVAGALIGGGAGAGVVTLLDEPGSGGSTAPTAQSVVIQNPQTATTATAAAAKAAPSVVTVYVQNGSYSGSGSGVVLTADGYVLTNNHVVTLESSEIGDVQVRTSDGTLYDAEVVGTDPSSDLAVVKLDGAEGLTPADFADSDQVQVGDVAVAIGAPLGPVEHRHRRDHQRHRPGRGHRLQRRTTRPSSTPCRPTRRSTPATPAAPWSTAPARSSASTPPSRPVASGDARVVVAERQHRRRLRDPQQHRDAHRAGDHRERLGHPGVPRGERPYRHRERELRGRHRRRDRQRSSPTAPPATAGLRAGDVVTAVGDRPVTSSTELTAAVRSSAPGDKVTLTVRRDDETATVDVTLGEAG